MRILFRSIGLIVVLFSFFSGAWAQATNTFPSSGSTGIGTTSPQVKLDVRGATANNLPSTSGTTPSSGTIMRVKGYDNSTLDFGNNSEAAWLQSTDIEGLNNKYALLLNPNGGKVSIGHSTPKTALDIQGATASSLPATSGSTPSSGTVFRIKGYDNSTLDFGNNSTKAWIQSTNISSLDSKYVLLLNPNGGNIGIGHSTPKTPLDIQGATGNSLPATSGTTPSTGTVFRIKGYDASTLDFGNGSEKAWIQSTDVDGLNNKYALLLNPNGGNVAVGLSSPESGYILAVGGNFKTSGNITAIGGITSSATISTSGSIVATGALGIQAKVVKVTTTPGADFVFDDDYKLRSLEETEIFIKANRHLPEIDPASEMEKNGLDMAKFQIQLLQKIEEMTLHNIDQEKKLKKQDALINELMTRLDNLEKKK